MKSGNRGKHTIGDRLSANLFRQVANIFVGPTVFVYPVHLTLLNFTEHVRRRLTVSGSRVAAHILVSYENSGSTTTQRIKRFMNLATLHQCVKYVLAPLAICALNRFQCIRRDERTLSLHLKLASYAADGLKTARLLNVKQINRIPMIWHICKAKREGLTGFSDASKRC